MATRPHAPESHECEFNRCAARQPTLNLFHAIYHHEPHTAYYNTQCLRAARENRVL